MLKELFVKDLPASGKVGSFFLVGDVTERRTKNDKPYLCVTLKDKTGEAEGRLWDMTPDAATTFVAGKYVKVAGEMSEWAGSKQLGIKQFREISEDERVLLNVTDFRMRAERPSQDMWDELLALVYEHVSLGEIGNVINALLEKNKEAFMIAPAAKRMHHNYEGGLLEHVLSLTNVAVAVADHYKLNKDLMVAGCILHDMGKVSELTYGDTIAYSTAGSLLGHITIMMMELNAICVENKVSEKVRNELLHMVASHHGLREWGSPIVPLMRESITFHFLDMIDSRLAIFDRLVKSDNTPGDFTAFVSEIGGPLYRPLPGETDVEQT